MREITLVELLQSGAHFGHKTSRWHPKMKPYLFSTRGGVHILDLAQTKQGLVEAGKTMSDIASMGGTVLFVGTKRQARSIIQEAAERAGMPYVTQRWLGGTFTNFKTIQKTIRRLEKLREDQMSPDFGTKYTKKERLLIEREVQKMERLLSGIQNMRKLPEAIYVADIKHDAIAVKEAKKSRIKIVGVADSNTDPTPLDKVIPCNDDPVSAIALVANYLADAILEGRNRYGQEPQAPKGKMNNVEPIAVDVSEAEENSK